MQKVNKQKNINRKKQWYKDLRTYFVGFLFLLMLILVVQLFIIKLIPTKYILIAVVAMLPLAYALWWLQYGKRVNKMNHILGKILIVFFCALLIVGNLYLYKASSTIGEITGSNTETDSMSIIVMKDSNFNELSDLTDARFGTNETTDKLNVEETKKDISKQIGDNHSYQNFDSYEAQASALYEGNVDAIILNEAYRGLMENSHPKFDSETKVIYTFDITKTVEDISKNVDVTNTSFNVYISGIDTYGSVTTKSRSDVNMIATINPNTHQIVLTSIPRDFYIPQTCQAGAEDKLTHTGIFGVDCTVSSVEQFLGIDINYYARVNFTSLIDIVDALGGITVENPVAFKASDGTYFFEAGNVYMDGAKALRFARERYNLAGGDRDRGKNQMRVLTAMINKAISPAIITNYTSIMNAVGGSFQTNMSAGEISSLINMQLSEMSGWSIEQQALNGSGATLYSPANGFYSYMMVPDMESVNAAVSQINMVLNAQ